MMMEFLVQFRQLLSSICRRSLLVLGLSAHLAAAQAAPPRADGESNAIVIEGERLSKDAAREMAAQFVRATGVAAGTVPAARWVDRVCPQVQGLAEVGKRAAEAKIRAVAAAAGIKVAPGSCRPNIVVSFTSDGAGLAREIERREPGRLGPLSSRARESVLTGAAPIRWMYTSELRGRSGERMSSGGSAVQSVPATHDGSGAGSSIGGEMRMHYENSLISTLTNRVLTSAIVIIDTDQAMGRRLDTLAAYAALVALAEIRNVDATPGGSILSMFASPAAPRDLTAQDKAFLRALYSLPLDRKAMQHRGQLVAGITRTLAVAEDQ